MMLIVSAISHIDMCVLVFFIATIFAGRWHMLEHPHNYFYSINCMSGITKLIFLCIFTVGTATVLQNSSITQNIFNQTIFRVSDEDLQSIFNDDVQVFSGLYCAVMCILGDSNTYYDVNTRRCSCQTSGYTYNAVTTGNNYVISYDTAPLTEDTEGDGKFQFVICSKLWHVVKLLF